jgi:glycosyltransferase involved in cell wall biosynthesis
LLSHHHTTLIPTYNGAPYIGQTLESVLSQRLSSHCVIVSDDSSTDNTIEIVERFSKWTNLRLVRQSRNLGMVQNWNALLKMVDTPTFTLISQDDLFRDEDVIPRALDILSHDLDASAVFSDTQLIDGGGRPLICVRYPRSAVFDGRVAARSSLVTCRNKFGLPLAIRSSNAGGLFYDSNIRYAADVEYASILAYRNPRFCHIPEPLFSYRVHLLSATRSVQHFSKSDYGLIADRCGIRLTRVERLRQRVNLLIIPWLRLAVLWSSAMRERILSVIARRFRL